MKCPVCEEGTLEHKKQPKETHKPETLDETHIWVCDVCPVVMLEWYDHQDTQALDNYLRRNL